MKDKRYLFVYGTLRQEERLNFMLKDLKFIGEAKLKGYDIYEKQGGYPVIIKGEGIVIGEIYDLTELMINRPFIADSFMRELDFIESEYNREVLDVKIGNKKYKALTYVYKTSGLIFDDKMKIFFSKIESGDWKKRFLEGKK